MSAKLAAAQAKMNILNSDAMSKAMRCSARPGPTELHAPADQQRGHRALRYAMGKIGDPYVWGAAGPNSFDCSGLVVWAYEQEASRCALHRALWNSGMHVSRSELEPGDLVFFYPDISHVGIFLGNGLMVVARADGRGHQGPQINWGIYVGAVRIA